jgi:hypothetical protein
MCSYIADRERSIKSYRLEGTAFLSIFLPEYGSRTLGIISVEILHSIQSGYRVEHEISNVKVTILATLRVWDPSKILSVHLSLYVGHRDVA